MGRNRWPLTNRLACLEKHPLRQLPKTERTLHGTPVESKVARTEERMAMQRALGDVSCDVRDVETANLTEGWREVLARTYTFGFAVRAVPASRETFHARTSRWQLGNL